MERCILRRNSLYETLTHIYSRRESEELNTGSSSNSCYPDLQHIGLYLSARRPTLWLSPSALAPDLMWDCMCAHACLWGTDLESRSENAWRRRPSASQLTASSSCSTEENMSTPDSNKPVFSIWQQMPRVYMVVYICGWLLLRKYLRRSGNSVDRAKDLSVCLSMVLKSWSTTSVYWSEPAQLPHLSICHLFGQLIKADQEIRGFNLTATKQMHIKDGLN